MQAVILNSRDTYKIEEGGKEVVKLTKHPNL